MTHVLFDDEGNQVPYRLGIRDKKGKFWRLGLQYDWNSENEWRCFFNNGKMKYKISQHGEVRSVRLKADGTVDRKKMTTTEATSGYKVINISDNGRKTQFLVHRLVAMYFLPRPGEDEVEVDHIDRNGLNNFVHNLRWSTKDDNMINRFKWGSECSCYTCGAIVNLDLVEIRNRFHTVD